MGLAISRQQSIVRPLWGLHWRGERSMGWVGKSDLLNAIGKTHSTLRAVHSLPHPAFTKAKRSFYLTPVDSVFCLLSGHCNTRHVSFPLRQHTPSTLFIAKSWLPSLIAHDLLTCFPEKICFYLSYLFPPFRIFVSSPQSSLPLSGPQSHHTSCRIFIPTDIISSRDRLAFFLSTQNICFGWGNFSFIPATISIHH